MPRFDGALLSPTCTSLVGRAMHALIVSLVQRKKSCCQKNDYKWVTTISSVPKRSHMLCA